MKLFKLRQGAKTIAWYDFLRVLKDDLGCFIESQTEMDLKELLDATKANKEMVQIKTF